MGGVYSSRDFRRFEKVFSSRVLCLLTERDNHSLQTGWQTHCHVDLPARFINHSCTANVGIRDNEVGAYDFFALRDVATGQELTWDYEASEYISASVPECL